MSIRAKNILYSLLLIIAVLVVWKIRSDRKPEAKPILLEGKTMGIIGFGRIGQRTGEIAKALGNFVLGLEFGLLGDDDAETLTAALRAEGLQVVEVEADGHRKGAAIV